MIKDRIYQHSNSLYKGDLSSALSAHSVNTHGLRTGSLLRHFDFFVDRSYSTIKEMIIDEGRIIDDERPAINREGERGVLLLHRRND